MTSKVFFCDISCHNSEEDNIKKFQKLIDKSQFLNNLDNNDKVAVKIDFEKAQNTPNILQYIIELIKMLKSINFKAFVTDTNTLNHHKVSSLDYLEMIEEKGFDYSNINCPVILADGINGNNESEVEINKEHFSSVKIAGDIYESDAMIVMSHLTTHPLIGMEGALKNLAIGCASRNGKKDLHRFAAPFIAKIRCLSCRDCLKACPEDAISIEGYAVIDYDRCIGCNSCIDLCPTNAIRYNTMNFLDFSKAVAEYAYGAILNKKYNKVIYINILTDINLDNCKSLEERPILDDIGILISYDAISIDKASYDLVNEHNSHAESTLLSDYEEDVDIFKSIHPNIDATVQLINAEELRLGNTDYELIEIK